MTAARWRVAAECAWQRHADWRLLGVPLLAAGLVAWLLWIPQRLAEHQRHQTASLSNEVVQPVAHRASVQSPVAGLREVLPTPEQANGLLTHIFELAETHGLQIGKVEYRWEEVLPGPGRNVPPGTARRLQLGLPLRADYPAVKAFVRELLAREPAVSIDALSLRRGTLEAGEANAAPSPDGMLWLSIWLSGLVAE